MRLGGVGVGGCGGEEAEPGGKSGRGKGQLQGLLKYAGGRLVGDTLVVAVVWGGGMALTPPPQSNLPLPFHHFKPLSLPKPPPPRPTQPYLCPGPAGTTVYLGGNIVTSGVV